MKKQRQKHTRTLLYSGKGGVGKTSLSAATAVLAARRGWRTLVVSTDPAHSLGDVLDMRLDSEPSTVAEGLDAMEIDVNRELERHWGVIHDWLSRFMAFGGIAESLAEEMAILPGMDELFSLLRIKAFITSGRYQLVVVDCAPTGETVRMLSVPEVLSFYFARIFPIQRAVARSVRPVARHLTDLPLPSDEVFSSVQDLYRELQGMGPLLCDPSRSSIRLVLNPERMVIKESQRLYTYLGLFGFPVDAVIANRVLPREASSPYFDRWLEIQAAHLEEARRCFEPLPLLEARLFDREMVGLVCLEELGREVFGETDPAAVLFNERPIEVRRESPGYVLYIRLPFAEKDSIDVRAQGDELVVQVANQRRHVCLPRSLVARPVVQARFEDQRLKVVFGRKGES